MHHYFATTHAAVVGNFVVCKSTTSVTRIFLSRHDATTLRFLKSKDRPMEQTFNLSKQENGFLWTGVNVKEKEESIVLPLTIK